jgi:hypothetical protein
MPEENVEIMRTLFERFNETGSMTEGLDVQSQTDVSGADAVVANDHREILEAARLSE